MSQQYLQAAEVIKEAILRGQYEAAAGTNRVLIATYFGIGKYVSLNSRQGFWGTGALETISSHLQKLLPGLRGYSATQLKEMRLFYEGWEMLDYNSSVATDENAENKSSVMTDDFQSSDTMVNMICELRFTNSVDFPIEDFMSVPFTHHSRILAKKKDFEERCYYIMRCAQEHLSVERLKQAMDNDDFHHQDKIPNNFTTALPAKSLARKAVMQFKDEYLLNFINVEEIGERDAGDIDERVVEQQIVHNIRNFIMTFGKDFSFIGNQYRIDAFGKSYFIDLLFFNRALSSLVAIELKTGELKPAYMGQLSQYLSLLDDFVRKPNENPSIGIVLCKNLNKAEAEYIVRQYDKPMGVATYKTSSEMPEKLRHALPDIEELKKLL